MKYNVLKDFKGSPDGRFAVDYRAGEKDIELTNSLAEVALAEKWVEVAADDAPSAKPAKAKKSVAAPEPAVPPAPTFDEPVAPSADVSTDTPSAE